MRRIVIILVLSVCGIVAAATIRPQQTATINPVVSVAAPTLSPTAAAVIAEIPKTIRIPSLGVTALVESVAKDKAGNMDIPRAVMNAAWYNLGSRPGTRGNAVIAGHFDTPEGKPSIFYRLDSLKPNDVIEVADASGKIFTYKVTKRALYKTESFPLMDVFGPSNLNRLNLITCSGTWDKNKKNYSDRLVVYSELVTSN